MNPNTLLFERSALTRKRPRSITARGYFQRNSSEESMQLGFTRLSGVLVLLAQQLHVANLKSASASAIARGCKAKLPNYPSQGET
jgi:hypothetical protein